MQFNKAVLSPKYQDFINSNLSSNLDRLLLSKTTYQDVEKITLLKQIEAKNKAKNKLPTWYNTANIYYPDKINIEQTSSETTALYKSHLLAGNTLFDATAGFGVDLYYFSKKIKNITACEKNEELVNITRHNFGQLGVKNVTLLNQNGMEFLKETDSIFDWIYIDPSRRDAERGKIFRFKDSEPNVVEHLDLILNKSKNVMIKSSPLMDLSLGIKKLKNVFEIHIIAIENEVKEMLWILKENHIASTKIRTSNIQKLKIEKFDFEVEKEQKSTPSYALPQTYLYEPNAAILKAGAFKILSKKYKVHKLHQHTHLYTSHEKIDFPGRIFKIVGSYDFNKKQLKKTLPNKANISIRNFPISVSDLRSAFKISDGGHQYLFFTTNMDDKKKVILCEKI